MVSRHILPLIEEAARRVYSVVRETPLAPLPREAGALGVAKLEQLQITGSFKLRGAVNKLMSLSKAEAAAGVITCPPSARLTRVMVGVTGTSMRELKRQERLIQIGIWADSPTHRDAIASALDPAIASMTWLVMPDTSMARLRYKSSPVSDRFENSTLFRRDLMYDVEYGTNEIQTLAQIVAVKETVSIPTMPNPIATVYT